MLSSRVSLSNAQYVRWLVWFQMYRIFQPIKHHRGHVRTLALESTGMMVFAIHESQPQSNTLSMEPSPRESRDL
jgi:hypothetical protein